MPFNRPPRIQPVLTKESVKIPAPPQLPQEPGAFSWMTIMIPVGGILLMVVLMGLLGSGGASGLMYLLTLPMMLGGYIVTYNSLQGQKKDFKEKLADGKRGYTEQLQKTENHLYSLREREQAVFRGMNPSLDECLQLAEKQDPRLGERRPSDPDFLMPRVGVGLLPTSIAIEPADTQKGSLELVKELETAKTLAEKFSVVPDVPIVARLMVTGSIGIAGKRADTIRSTRAMLCHLIIHHWFTEVQVAALAEKQTLPDWHWLAAVPHASAAFNWQKTDARFSDPESWKVLLELEKELKRQRADSRCPKNGRRQFHRASAALLGDRAGLLPAGILASRLGPAPEKGEGTRRFCALPHAGSFTNARRMRRDPGRPLRQPHLQGIRGGRDHAGLPTGFLRNPRRRNPSPARWPKWIGLRRKTSVSRPR